jgi:hypothetical protein
MPNDTLGDEVEEVLKGASEYVRSNRPDVKRRDYHLRNMTNIEGTESIPPLSATTYFRKGDKLFLRGKSVNALEGTLQSGAREVFKDGSQEVKYSLNFLQP